jgi:formylglycine-generating enzyme required for sulfatase activity
MRLYGKQSLDFIKEGFQAIPRLALNPTLLVLGILLAIPRQAPAQSGQVLDEGTDQALRKAIVQVKPSGVMRLNGADGRFDLEATSIRHTLGSPRGPWQVSRQGRRITFVARHALRMVTVEVVSLSGRVLASVYRGSLPAGKTEWMLPQTLPPYGLLRVRLPETSSLLPLPGSGGRALRKASAEPETLWVSRYGYAPTAQVVNGAGEVQVKLKRLTGEVVPPGMRCLAGGQFIMGSDSDNANESPAHEVELDSLYLDTTEVTQADFYVLTGRKPWEHNKEMIKGLPARHKLPLHPAWSVNWFDAAMYCNARSKRDGLDTVYTFSKVTCDTTENCTLEDVESHLQKNGYRLPTEAQWEYACRAGTTTKFFWGNTASDGGDYAWANENAEYSTHPVATKKANAFGLYDMPGSVEEWLEDWHDSVWPKDVDGNLIVRNPIRTTRAVSGRATRGRNYYILLSDMRSSRRGASNPEYLSALVGFRVSKPKQ